MVEYPKKKKCPRCLKHPPNQSKRKDYRPAMCNMYIRVQGVMIPMGWFCRNCGKMMRLRKMDVKGESSYYNITQKK